MADQPLENKNSATLEVGSALPTNITDAYFTSFTSEK